MRPNQPSHEMKTFIPRDKANHPVRPIALSRPFLHQLKINPYLCHRLGDTPVVPTSCIKGNPVEIRNSARYCKAILKKEESILHATIRKDGKAAFRKG